MEQVIRFCGAPDGVRLAYAAYGHGPVIVKAAHWLTHLEYDWRSPVWRHWLDGLGIASFFQTNYGPTLATLARLSDDGRRAFQKDLIALAGASNRATDGTLVSDWEFQIAVGTRA